MKYILIIAILFTTSVKAQERPQTPQAYTTNKNIFIFKDDSCNCLKIIMGDSLIILKAEPNTVWRFDSSNSNSKPRWRLDSSTIRLDLTKWAPPGQEFDLSQGAGIILNRGNRQYIMQ